MSEQIPIGVCENLKPARMRGTHDIAIAASVTLIVILCLIGAFAVSLFVRFAGVTENRIAVLELNQKVSQMQAKVVELERRIESESQRLTGMIDNHNKLVQALNTVFMAHEAKLGTLDAKAVVIETKVATMDVGITNVVDRIGKLEKEKKR